MIRKKPACRMPPFREFMRQPRDLLFFAEPSVVLCSVAPAEGPQIVLGHLEMRAQEP